MDHIMQFDLNADDFPMNSLGFGGLHQSLAKDQRDADALCAQPGWTHLRYEGHGSIPLVDRKHRMIACIGGTPKDVARWKKKVVEPLVDAIEKGSRSVKFSQKEKKHKPQMVTDPHADSANKPNGFYKRGGQLVLKQLLKMTNTRNGRLLGSCDGSGDLKLFPVLP
ncbi:hypothetical protein BDZ89DRAFT_1045858 [Hymenopellis radicata]|nr:hypothetical protein BDZ89DRAFT_1045858 [Hymenopellis radicata]